MSRITDMDPMPAEDKAPDETLVSPLWLRLSKYVLGGLTKNERVDFERWIAAESGRAADVAKVQRVDSSPVRGSDDEARIERALAQVVKRAGIEIGETAIAISSVAPVGTQISAVLEERRSERWGWRRASVLGKDTLRVRQIAPYAFASLVIGLLGLMLGWQTKSPLSRRPQDVAATIYTTGRGERANITLPDGSTVALSVASRLEVPVDYLRGDRALRLTGEALFTVQHQSESSFTVTSGDATARVLGTSFLVRHYPDDTATTVAVRGGKVGVRSLVLSAWQQSEVTAHTAARVRDVTPSRFGFATGVLTLDAMPLRDAVVELSRWYDLDIRLGDSSLATRRIDGGFAAGASSDLIAIFEQTLDVRVVRDGREITLYPRSER